MSTRTVAPSPLVLARALALVRLALVAVPLVRQARERQSSTRASSLAYRHRRALCGRGWSRTHSDRHTCR